MGRSDQRIRSPRHTLRCGFYHLQVNTGGEKLSVSLYWTCSSSADQPGIVFRKCVSAGESKPEHSSRRDIKVVCTLPTLLGHARPMRSSSQMKPKNGTGSIGNGLATWHMGRQGAQTVGRRKATGAANPVRAADGVGGWCLR